ncbi:MAG TPA: hypothetical protein VJ981_02945, partial [Gammaproteobacteria bacterium]|nr:hypothetical protein [Gammaproteobacteria bacterium]
MYVVPAISGGCYMFAGCTLFRSRLPRLASLFLVLASVFSGHVQADSYELVFLGKQDSDAWLGAEQGLTEANHQGEFMGLGFSMKTLPVDGFTPDMTSDAIALLIDGDSQQVRDIIQSTSGLAVLNITNPDDGLRAACFANGLHISPSQQMLADAENQWRQAHPDSRAKAQAWHPDFVKYAARDLNKRFKAAYNREMNDHSWAGW